VTAVEIAAGTDIVGLADSRRLPHHMATDNLPSTAIQAAWTLHAAHFRF